MSGIGSIHHSNTPGAVFLTADCKSAVKKQVEEDDERSVTSTTHQVFIRARSYSIPAPGSYPDMVELQLLPGAPLCKIKTRDIQFGV